MLVQAVLPPRPLVTSPRHTGQATLLAPSTPLLMLLLLLLPLVLVRSFPFLSCCSYLTFILSLAILSLSLLILDIAFVSCVRHGGVQVGGTIAGEKAGSTSVATRSRTVLV